MTPVAPAWLIILSGVLLAVDTLACVAFIVIYTRRAKWWRNDVGRNLVTMSASLGGLLGYSALAFLWPGIPGRVIIRTVLFLSLTAAVIWRVVVFHRIGREIDRKKEDQG